MRVTGSSSTRNVEFGGRAFGLRHERCVAHPCTELRFSTMVMIFFSLRTENFTGWPEEATEKSDIAASVEKFSCTRESPECVELQIFRANQWSKDGTRENMGLSNIPVKVQQN